MRMPIIMLNTSAQRLYTKPVYVAAMFQFSWPKWTAKPFLGPNRRCCLLCLMDAAVEASAVRASS